MRPYASGVCGLELPVCVAEGNKNIVDTQTSPNS
jgi:hypothetical protein